MQPIGLAGSAVEMAGHDARHWDARYADPARPWSDQPSSTVAEVLAARPPGRAIDLAAGDGRHAAWLATRGWQVIAVDFSPVGIGRGRAECERRGLTVDWVVADVNTWQPPPEVLADGVDLVLLAYVHLPEPIIARAASWLAPGGRLAVVGHALRNRTEGVGGPSDPALLHTEEQMRAAAAGMRIEQLGEVLRPTPEGAAIDLALVARRPSS